jgi:hypothetical protein
MSWVQLLLEFEEIMASINNEKYGEGVESRAKKRPGKEENS